MPPPTIDQLLHIVLQHQQDGRLLEAETLCRKVVADHPNNADAVHLLGLLCFQLGKPDAVSHLRRCILLRPDMHQAHSNLGHLLSEQGQIEQAIASCRRAVELRPDFPEGQSNLGNALQGAGRFDEAIAAYQRALALRPGYAKAHNNLGNVLLAVGRIDQAMASYRRAIELEPNYAEAHSNLGSAQNALGRHEEAVACHRRAIALRPHYPHAHSSLGVALLGLGRCDEAIAAGRLAISQKPDLAHAHFNLALVLLSRGDFAMGWRQYEWRWLLPEFPEARRALARPRWDGGDLAGRTILLHAEQGIGDTIQFVRYLPMVVARGGRVLLECQPELQRLLSQANLGQTQTVERKDPPSVQFDMHAPLMSLPLLLGDLNPPAVGAAKPSYLQVDGALVEQWKARIPRSGKMKIGLAWAGRPTHKSDRHRSISLRQLAPLAKPQVEFYSLQMGDAAAQTSAPPPGLELTDLTSDIHDFADTAALIANLDLIITVDTAVAHLAGAMAKPVWLLLPFAPDFRWQWTGRHTPWYPTMRLFRQSKLGDWSGPLGQMAADLP